MTLPPPQYARKGGEVLAAQLAKVGVIAKIENVEWAQWLGGTFKGNFDLTVINHVEPLDYMQYANTGYYWGYDSKAFRELAAKHAATTDTKGRTKLFATCNASSPTTPSTPTSSTRPDGGVTQRPERLVGELADFCERHGGCVLAVSVAASGRM